MKPTYLLLAACLVSQAQQVPTGLFNLNQLDLHYHSGMERPVDMAKWLDFAVKDGRRVVALIDHLELYRKSSEAYEKWRTERGFEARYPVGAAGHTALFADFDRAAKNSNLIVFKAWEIYEGELDTGIEEAPMRMVDLIGWHISPNHGGKPPDGKLLLRRVAQIKEIQKRYEQLFAEWQPAIEPRVDSMLITGTTATVHGHNGGWLRTMAAGGSDRALDDTYIMTLKRRGGTWNIFRLQWTRNQP